MPYLHCCVFECFWLDFRFLLAARAGRAAALPDAVNDCEGAGYDVEWWGDWTSRFYEGQPQLSSGKLPLNVTHILDETREIGDDQKEKLKYL